jgi:hypothetical protein
MGRRGSPQRVRETFWCGPDGVVAFFMNFITSYCVSVCPYTLLRDWGASRCDASQRSAAGAAGGSVRLLGRMEASASAAFSLTAGVVTRTRGERVPHPPACLAVLQCERAYIRGFRRAARPVHTQALSRLRRALLTEAPHAAASPAIPLAV